MDTGEKMRCTSCHTLKHHLLAIAVYSEPIVDHHQVALIRQQVTGCEVAEHNALLPQ